MSKYVAEEPKEYAVYLLYKGSTLETVLEYFYTISEALDFISSYPKSTEYTIHVGKFE